MPQPPHDKEYVDAVRSMLADLTEQQLRTFGVSALRRWRRRSPSEDRFSLNGPGLDLVEVLADAKGIKCDTNACKEVFIHHMTKDWLRPVAEFFWWMARAGLLIPQVSQHYQLPDGYALTGAGVRFLESGDDEHPLMPGFVERLRSRCPGIPDAAVELLTDASACLDAGLVRPAVTLMGVAYEAIIQETLLLAGGHTEDDVRKAKPWKRINMLRGLIANRGLKEDEKSAALRACDFADHVRGRRNDGAHATPKFPFDSAAEGEELILSACRHLAAFAPMFAAL